MSVPTKRNSIHRTQMFQRRSTTRSFQEVQALLGLINYYRKFVDAECQEALNKVKDSIANPPILIYPDFTQPFRVTTDASNEALGAVLSQIRNNRDHPIAFASRTLSDTEKRYSTIEKEMLGIVWATHTFRPYLLGRPFTVFTDHQPLRGIANLKDQTSRLARFRHKLSEYEFEIVYKPGTTNLNADALSRLPTTCINVGVITRAQVTLKDTKSMGKTCENASTTTVLTKREDIQEVLRSFHDSPLGGHQGVMKTYMRIRNQYKWKGMQRQIKDYIRKCPKCQKNKSGLLNKEPMVITDTADRPFDKVYMDMVGPCQPPPWEINTF
ncbi:Retrovirus-related Pol polyprotein from transposon 297 [Eumeta japonica]|uniref:RNA-directed DNA polymerase n=1 Tax=Eumeta variegata TaxID=151549 RepID=A0A4C1SD47_EUMVA|nr:Retrovirus-related Pol polyprotein from transposon 297 [Eumeta japonica]